MESANFERIRNLIAITSEIERTVMDRNPNVRIWRINNTLDERFFAVDDRREGPSVLFVGWMIHRKGVHLLLEAAEILSREIPALKVRFVGPEMEDGDMSGLKAKHRSLIEQGTVSILGAIEQERLYGELSRCAILCLPSLAESAPMAISQAMAAGKAVVATKVGGVPEMVEDGVTGKLVPPGDVESLAAALREALAEDAECRAMGERARAIANRRYRPDSVARATLDAYREVLRLDAQTA